MTEVLGELTRRFVESVAPESTAVQQEMEAQAQQEEFPIIGPAAGGWLRLLARLVEASSVFEFGSGFGYSATWFLRGLGPDGQVVLTEHDEAELDEARNYLERAGVSDRAIFEPGDALSIVQEYDGPFDIVLFDHQKHRYLDALSLVAEKLAPHGVVIADNVMRGPYTPEEVLAALEGEEVDSEGAQGMADYLEHVRSSPDFDTSLLPVGNGLAVSALVA